MSAAIAPVAGSTPSARRAGRVGVRRDEPRAVADEADRLRDRLERVVAGLADDDVVGVGLGHDEAGLVQRGRDARPRRSRTPMPPGSCCLQEVGGRERRGPDAVLGHVRARDARSRADRSRGVKIELFVSTRKGVPWSRHCCSSSAAPGTGVVLVDEHAVHVGQPALDLFTSSHASSLGRARHASMSGGFRARCGRSARRARVAQRRADASGYAATQIASAASAGSRCAAPLRLDGDAPADETSVTVSTVPGPMPSSSAGAARRGRGR